MIYLDNAATTFPKPRCLTTEIEKCIKQYCGNPGRSGHILSLKSAEKIYQCRETLASFFGSSHPENVVFTLNTTYALNLAIKTLYIKNSHVLISNMEHNSVLRPIHSLQKAGELSYSVFDVMQETENIINELEKRRRCNTKTLIMTHASNICGKLFPIKEVGKFCRKHNITFIVDAAQSAGISNIKIEEFNIDALCVPAHKGLYGPQGLGFVIFGGKTPTRTLFEGGNGTNSLSPDMGTILPESFEAGTMATPLIAGLEASVKWLQSISVENINHHEKELARKLSERLKSLPGSQIYGPESPETGILLFDNSNIPQHKLYSELCEKNICARNGFHCAPLAHKTLNTPSDGAIRFSLSCFNTSKDIDETYRIIKNIVK
ncbi:MAG: aminotransferase class V-fold PLP-dependent enzyme [Clostridia bacterium]|nr:aminotransferase class V-fold PLP-dependent enzyme [Clostridia bacterium]